MSLKKILRGSRKVEIYTGILGQEKGKSPVKWQYIAYYEGHPFPFRLGRRKAFESPTFGRRQDKYMFSKLVENRT